MSLWKLRSVGLLVVVKHEFWIVSPYTQPSSRLVLDIQKLVVRLGAIRGLERIARIDRDTTKQLLCKAITYYLNQHIRNISNALFDKNDCGALDWPR